MRAEGMQPGSGELPGSLSYLPREVVEIALKALSCADLCGMACAHPLLRLLAESDQPWERLFQEHFPGLAPLVAAAAPAWWVGAPWKARFAALCSGAGFPAQVYHREQGNAHEDFMLSCYDATITLSGVPAPPPPPGAGGPRFTASYLPMGRRQASVMEQDLPLTRLRLVPGGVASDARSVFRGGSGGGLEGLAVGEEVEVQWKGRRGHPFGWWFGSVAAVLEGRVTLVFRQYPPSSVWHSVKASVRPGKAALVNNDKSFGYMGGLRRLTDAEAAEWRRHCGERPSPAAEEAAPLAEAEEEGAGAAEAGGDGAPSHALPAPAGGGGPGAPQAEEEAPPTAAAPLGPPGSASYNLAAPGEQPPLAPPAPPEGNGR